MDAQVNTPYEKAKKALEKNGGFIVYNGMWKNVSEPPVLKEWHRRLKVQGIVIPQ